MSPSWCAKNSKVRLPFMLFRNQLKFAFFATFNDIHIITKDMILFFLFSSMSYWSSICFQKWKSMLQNKGRKTNWGWNYTLVATKSNRWRYMWWFRFQQTECMLQRWSLHSLPTSMTSLLPQTVAQPTKWRFLPENLSQLVNFVNEHAFTWSWVDKNHQNLIFKVIFLCQKSIL